MKTTKYKIEMKLILFSLTVLLIGAISAVGVATPYWEENPLKLAPGESTTVALSLQNMVGEEDLALEAEISDNAGGIATISGNSKYSVPLGSEDVPVKIKVEIPKNAGIGDSYLISVSFQQVSSGEGGMLHVAGAFTSKIPIEIVGEEESELFGTSKGISPILYIVLGVIALGIIIFFIKRKSLSKK